MGIEIDLLSKYPKVKRDLTARLEAKSEEARSIGRRFDFDYFDGNRNHGYGGFTYQERFWKPVVPDLISHFELSNKSRVLDIGCAKGFFLHDLKGALPGIEIHGVDISEYAIANAIETVRAQALQEIQRVSGGRAFITVDAYRNELEKERMEAWNLTALTMMSVDEWKDFFAEVGYNGDYYWFIP